MLSAAEMSLTKSLTRDFHVIVLMNIGFGGTLWSKTSGQRMYGNERGNIGAGPRPEVLQR